MKNTYYLSLAAAGLSLVLSVVLFIFGSINQGLEVDIQKQQEEIQKQQEPINRWSELNQRGSSILRDMSISSIKDENMKVLLNKYGYPVPQAAPSPAPSSSTPASTPTPAPAPTPSSTPALR